jgi:hypothetical protein
MKPMSGIHLILRVAVTSERRETYDVRLLYIDRIEE